MRLTVFYFMASDEFDPALAPATATYRRSSRPAIRRSTTRILESSLLERQNYWTSLRRLLLSRVFERLWLRRSPRPPDPMWAALHPARPPPLRPCRRCVRMTPSGCEARVCEEA